MATGLMARLECDSDSDPDLAAEHLRKAGYTVHRMPDHDLRRYHLLDDHIEAVIAGSDDDKIMDAVCRAGNYAGSLGERICNGVP